MAEISDILKIGKDKYLEKNLEQNAIILSKNGFLVTLSVSEVISKME